MAIRRRAVDRLAAMAGSAESPRAFLKWLGDLADTTGVIIGPNRMDRLVVVLANDARLAQNTAAAQVVVDTATPYTPDDLAKDTE